MWHHSDTRSSAVTLMLTPPRYLACSKIKYLKSPHRHLSHTVQTESLNTAPQLDRFLGYTCTDKSQKFFSVYLIIPHIAEACVYHPLLKKPSHHFFVDTFLHEVPKGSKSNHHTRCAQLCPKFFRVKYLFLPLELQQPGYHAWQCCSEGQ